MSLSKKKPGLRRVPKCLELSCLMLRAGSSPSRHAYLSFATPFRGTFIDRIERGVRHGLRILMLSQSQEET